MELLLPASVSQSDPPPAVTDPLPPEIIPVPASEPVEEPFHLPGIDPPPVTSQGQGSQPTSEAIPSPPEVTTSIDSNDGNLNVSVRVDSAGTDGSAAQEQVVSPPTEPDITTSGSAGGTPAPDATDEPAPTDSTPPGSTNTNVAVRVASPGDNGPVSQDNGSSSPAAQAAGQPSDAQDRADTSSSDPTSAAPVSPEATQYQGSNSQYQSEPIPDNSPPSENDTDDVLEPWNWMWELSICDGTATTISTETGSQESRDWTWNWIWDWSCDPAPDGSASSTSTPGVTGEDRSTDAPSDEDRGSGLPQAGPASIPAGTPANVNVSIRVLSPGDDGPVSQRNAAPSAASATPTQAAPGADDPAWAWTWTFTWCGTTMAIPMPAGQGLGAGTGLDWVWNWIWTRDCENTTQPTPDQGAVPGSGDTGGDTAPSPHSSSHPAATASGSVTNAPSVSSSASPAAADAPVADVPGPDLSRIGFSVDLDLLPLASGMWPALSSSSIAEAFAEAFAEPVRPQASWVGVVVGTTAVGARAPLFPTILVPLPPPLPVLVSSGIGETGPGQLGLVVSGEAISHWLAPQTPDTPRPDTRKPGGATSQAASPTPATAVVRSASAGWVQAPSRHSKTQQPRHPAEARAGYSRFSESGSGRGSQPLGLPPLQVVGSNGSAGGGAPSVLLVGFATLIGFFVIAAPGLGRRIRHARVPSPRGRISSTIDRPG